MRLQRLLPPDRRAVQVFMLAMHIPRRPGLGADHAHRDVAVALGVAVEDAEQVAAPRRVVAGDQRLVERAVRVFPLRTAHALRAALGLAQPLERRDQRRLPGRPAVPDRQPQRLRLRTYSRPPP